MWKRTITGLILFAGSACTNTGDNQDDAQADTAETSPQPSCSDALVLWAEHNVCAPPIDECVNPWEIPLVGGDCVAVGPRACPRLWDDESTEECEPGELVDCPEGLVLNDDETACVPLFSQDCADDELASPGGGCRRIGPAGDLDNDGTTFDECPVGYLALLGGGCVLVGPRACPQIWEPRSETYCEPGEMLPCPADWEESEDGLHCEPVYHVCPAGKKPVPGGGCERVVPAADDCPTNAFPDPPQGAQPVLYASATADCAQNCGPVNAPYPSIQAAVDALPAGGTVLVGPGIYAEGLDIDKDVTITGLCAGNTRISGSTPIPGSSGDGMPEAGLVVSGNAEVIVEGLAFEAPAIGTHLEGTGSVTLRNLEFSGNKHRAVAAKGGNVLIEDSWIHDVTAASAEPGGEGIFATGQVSLTAAGCLLENTTTAGIQVGGNGATVALSDSTVRDTQWNVDGNKGSGLRIEGGAQATAQNCVFERNCSVAVRAAGVGSTLEMKRSVVRFTRMQVDGTAGAGVQTSGGAAILLEECLIAGNRFAGVIAWDPDSLLTLYRSVVRDTGPDSTGEKGRGAYAHGGRIVLRGSSIVGSMEAGIAAQGPECELDAAWSRVADTVPSDKLVYGEGVMIVGGAQGHLSHVLLENNAGEALHLSSGADAEIVSSVLRNGKCLAGGTMGWGLDAFTDSSAELTACLIENNRGFGVWGEGETATIRMERSEVRTTMPDETGDGGLGVALMLGAAIELRSCRVVNSHTVGLYVTDLGTRADLTDTIIADTLPVPTNERSGQGVEISYGAELAAAGCLFLRNCGLSLNLNGEQSILEMTDSNIRDTQLDGTDIWGIGLLVSRQSNASATRLLVEDSPNYGVRVDEGELTMTESVVRGTRADSQEEGVAAFLVIGDAKAAVDWTLLENNMHGGFWVQEAQARLTARHSVVRNTMESAGAGLGAFVIMGEADLSGVLLEQAPFTGAAAQGQGTRLALGGSIVRDTYGMASGEFGEGVVVVNGAEVELRFCQLRENAAAGIMVLDPTTVAHVTATAVSHTAKGSTDVVNPDGVVETQIHGDGIAVAVGAHAIIDSSLFFANTRTGIFFSQATGGVTGTVVLDNESFGMALDESADSVDYSDQANFFFGNATKLPPSLAADVTTNPEGLPLPKAVEISDIPTEVW